MNVHLNCLHVKVYCNRIMCICHLIIKDYLLTYLLNSVKQNKRSLQMTLSLWLNITIFLQYNSREDMTFGSHHHPYQSTGASSDECFTCSHSFNGTEAKYCESLLHHISRSFT